MKIKKNNKKIMLRLFSILFSLFIWLYVISSAKVEIDKSVPLTVNLPEGFAFVSEPPREIIYSLKGPRIFVRKFLDKKMKVTISEKSYYKKGIRTYSFGLNNYQIDLPLGIELLATNIKKIKFKLEREITRSIPVELSIDKKIKGDFKLEQIKISPEKVDITGAKSVIRKLKSISTLVIDDPEQIKEGKGEVELTGLGQHILIEPKKVKFNFQLISKYSEFTFSRIPIIFQSTKRVKSALPKAVNIILKGEKEFLDKVNSSEIKIFARVKNKTESDKRIKIPLTVELPPELELVRIEPSEVSIMLESL